MTLKTWKKRIAIHILPNISRSKGNQTMKFGQLIEYNWDTFSLKKHTESMAKKLFFFSNIVLYSKSCHFSITRFDILIFYNILHLEMNFGNVY